MSRLNTSPACAPVNASLPALRLRAHDSEPVWLARPSPYGSFIHTSTPVYPGAPMMTYANSLPRREAGSLINRPVTTRTIPDFRHPRTGSTALLLSATTELLVIDLVPQHDPQANAQLARHRHARFPQSLLHEFAAIEPL